MSDLVNISLLSLPNFRLTPVCPGLTMVQACSIRAVTKKKELILRSLFDIIANYLIYSKQCSIMEVNQSHFVEHDFFWD